MTGDGEVRGLAGQYLAANQSLPLADLVAISERLDDAAARAGTPLAGFLSDAVRGLVQVRTGAPGVAALLERTARAYVGSDVPSDDPLCGILAANVAYTRFRPEEVQGILREVVARDDLPDDTRALVLCSLGLGVAWAGDLTKGSARFAEALALAQDSCPPAVPGLIAMLLGKAEALRGEVVSARQHLIQARDLSAAAGAVALSGGHLECFLFLPLVDGDEEAFVAVLEVLVDRQQGDQSGLTDYYRLELATARSLSGDEAGARAVLGDGLVRAPDRGDVAWLHAWREWVLDPDSVTAMTELAREAERPRPADGLETARVVWLLGRHHARRGRRGDAIRLLESAGARLAQMGARGYVARIEEELAAVLVPAGSSASTVLPPINGAAATLTRAERRIAEAVCGALSNREIADLLFLSERTVEAHLSSIYRKLGVRSRTELAIRM